MATIENGTGPTELAAKLRKMPDEVLIAQCFVQQGAVYAVSWLMANGCNEERAAEMLASLRVNSKLIRAEALLRGKPSFSTKTRRRSRDA